MNRKAEARAKAKAMREEAVRTQRRRERFLRFGIAGAVVVIVDVWLDFLCPHCKEFEDTSGVALNEYVAAGEVRVVYHPLRGSGRAYSARANNAFGCAADEGMAAEFVAAAFATPQQWSADSLAGLGESAGIGGDYEACLREGTYDDWADSVTPTASAAGVTGTPTVDIDGTRLDLSVTMRVEEFRAAVDEALAAVGN